jgi:hypothetical protein
MRPSPFRMGWSRTQSSEGRACANRTAKTDETSADPGSGTFGSAVRGWRAPLDAKGEADLLVHATFQAIAEQWIEGAELPGADLEDEVKRAWLAGNLRLLQRALDAYRGACLRACLALAPCEHVRDLGLIRWRLEHPDSECSVCGLLGTEVRG